jgi:hypothetical protein
MATLFPRRSIPPEEVRTKSGHPLGRMGTDAERLALPKSLAGGNLSRNKLVIRWISVSRG